MASYFIGVDVGTGSARAGVFTSSGDLLGSHAEVIAKQNIQPDFYEQSSHDIWSKVCDSVKRALQKSGVAAKDIAGIGFAATCSLVLLDEHDQPVSASSTGEADWNIV
jgi:ribulose kinase